MLPLASEGSEWLVLLSFTPYRKYAAAVHAAGSSFIYVTEEHKAALCITRSSADADKPARRDVRAMLIGSVGLHYIFYNVIIHIFPSYCLNLGQRLVKVIESGAVQSFNRLRFLLLSYSDFSLKLAVSEKIDFEKCHDLENPLGVTQGH